MLQAGAHVALKLRHHKGAPGLQSDAWRRWYAKLLECLFPMTLNRFASRRHAQLGQFKSMNSYPSLSCSQHKRMNFIQLWL